MKVCNLNSFYFINKVKNHDEVKEKLLYLIKNNEADSTTYNDAFITRTDYHLDENHERTYLPLFFETIESIMQEQSKFMFTKEMTIHHAWFQQYWQFDKHDWHTHGQAQFANIYYLEIIKEIDVEEGDLITFPAYIIHRSNTNSAKQKTVISFNSSFELTDAQKVDNLL
jgi:hypothetical protein